MTPGMAGRVGVVVALSAALIGSGVGCGGGRGPATLDSLPLKAEFNESKMASAVDGSAVVSASGLSTSNQSAMAEWEVETSLDQPTYQRQISDRFVARGFKPRTKAEGALEFSKEFKGDVVVVSIHLKTPSRYSIRFSARPF